MNYYLYIKTISNKAIYVKNDFLKVISEKTGINLFSVKQKFIGNGFALLYKSDNKEDVYKLQKQLNELKINSFILDDNQINNRKTFLKVHLIKEYDNRFECILKDERKINIYKKDRVLIIVGNNNTRQKNTKLNSLLLTKDFISFIYFQKQNITLKINPFNVNLSGIKNSTKFSHSQNFITFLSSIKKNAQYYVIDDNYSLNYIPDLGDDINEYAAKSIIFFNNDYYTYNYDKYVFSDIQKNETNSKLYDFDYKIYFPHELILKKSLLNFQNLSIAVFIPFIFILIFLFSLRDILIKNYAYIFLICSVYYSIIFFKYLKFKLFIEDIPSSKIASLSIGLREVKGRVLDYNSVPAYISGVKCVFFRYYKYQKVKTKENTKWELKKIGEYLPKSFFIEQDGYILQIDTHKATFDLCNKNKYMKPYFLNDSIYYDKDTYYIEEILPVYSDVYILGSVVSIDTKEEYSQFLKKMKYDKEFMKQFDENNDKTIDIEEWERAKNVIDNLFYQKQNEKKQNELLKMSYNKDDRILYISDRSEKEIITRLNIYLIIMLILDSVSLILFLRGIL